MARTIGVFQERGDRLDWLHAQCEGPDGRHGDLAFRANDPRADHVLVLGTPIPSTGRPRLRALDRLAGLVRGDTAARRLDACWRRLARDRARTVALVLEPPAFATDLQYAVARRHAVEVHGADPRATHPCVLPATWEVEGDVHALRTASPAAKPVALAAVISGKSFLPGHRARLDFLARLRAAGIPLDLHGRGLPASLLGRGETPSKAAVFGPARHVLAIENHADGDLYVSEKLWDPLLAWALPLYYGSAAADRRIPPEAFVRLPDLAEAGVRVVRETLADPTAWSRRLDAIAEARRRILGDLRLVEWVRRHVVGRHDGAGA